MHDAECNHEPGWQLLSSVLCEYPIPRANRIPLLLGYTVWTVQCLYPQRHNAEQVGFPEHWILFNDWDNSSQCSAREMQSQSQQNTNSRSAAPALGTHHSVDCVWSLRIEHSVNIPAYMSFRPSPDQVPILHADFCGLFNTLWVLASMSSHPTPQQTTALTTQ